MPQRCRKAVWFLLGALVINALTVLLFDINMPGMNGFQLLEHLKKHPSLRGIPIVMLMTSNAESDISQAYSLHASSYLVKSASVEAFMVQVETFLAY